MLEKPWLVQRCEIRDGRLRYDYMGSTEFEVGNQAKSIKRIFEKGVCLAQTNVFVGDKELRVHMIAAKGFPFAEYQYFLQRFAEGEFRLQESTYFDDAVKRAVGLTVDAPWSLDTNAWFDFKNDVLWTLNRVDCDALVVRLKELVLKWAEKK